MTTYRQARENTEAKKIVRRVDAWIANSKNREVLVKWKWNQVNRFDRMGVFVAMDNGEEVLTKYYQNGDMRLPNPDFHKTNSGGHRLRALEMLVSELERLDAKNEDSNG